MSLKCHYVYNVCSKYYVLPQRMSLALSCSNEQWSVIRQLKEISIR